MNKKQFIETQKEDIKTLNNSKYDLILKLFEKYIPQNSIIDENKSVEGMFNTLYDYAKKHQSNDFYCIDSEEEFKKIMFGYLKITPGEEKKEIEISLEDIF